MSEPLPTETADQEFRDGLKRELESQMTALVSQLDQLIEMHERCGGETIQKTYLYGARHKLLDGLQGFEWERDRAPPVWCGDPACGEDRAPRKAAPVSTPKAAP